MVLDLSTASIADIAATIAELSNPDMPQPTREEWLAERRKGIGGSDAPIILGLSEYKSAYTLWAEKAGDLPEVDFSSEAAEWGRLLEPVILSRFAEITGRVVFHWPQTRGVTHARLDWMRCTPDGMQFDVNGDGIGVTQVKTTGVHHEDDWEDGPPLIHQVQIQHEMAVAKAQWGTLIVLIGGQRLLYWDVERNEEFIGTLIEAESAFWDRVLSGDPPPLDASESTRNTIKRLHPDDNGEAITLPAEAIEWDVWMQRLKKDIETLRGKYDELDTRMRAAIGPNTYGILPNGTARYSLKTKVTKAHMRRESKTRALLRQE